MLGKDLGRPSCDRVNTNTIVEVSNGKVGCHSLRTKNILTKNVFRNGNDAMAVPSTKSTTEQADTSLG